MFTLDMKLSKHEYLKESLIMQRYLWTSLVDYYFKDISTPHDPQKT